MLPRLVEASDIPGGNLHVVFGDLVPKFICFTFFLLDLTASCYVDNIEPSTGSAIVSTSDNSCDWIPSSNVADGEVRFFSHSRFE